MRIYLIGMPASGKSTLGRELARTMNYEFIDLDNYIEKQACMFVDEIFEAYGEEHFRALESNALKELGNMDNIVVSTGGGIIKNKRNKELMKGLKVYLLVSVKELELRAKVSTTIRPLLKEKSMAELYFERYKMYEYFADMTVNNKNLTKTVKEIIEYAKSLNN